MANDNKQLGKVITGVVRLSYANVFTPRAGKNGGEAKYGTAILIPKKDEKTLKLIQKAIAAVKADPASLNKWGGKLSGLKMPLHDGDADEAFVEEHPEYAGHYYLNARNSRKPGIIDLDGNPIIDPNEVYSGCYARASITFFAFNNESKGIGVSLNNIMKVADGERLGGGQAAAEDDFAEFIGNDDDELNALLG
ncbi:hypothetical protein P22_1992 [Propionispora sp. 2/2-37]|uniref:DUF2815 family protein n=1 Tax=Propionispora sp. 2/2-37 TaxID=1677858 RepID=UPI0006BB624A|nr:DUF2815 family protein [Propionispora sp. 2/2-37]CUH95906.1 hypothetical protein P22_1992 [Propionispora sp. 2/2-37]